MEFLLESGVHNSFGVRLGVRISEFEFLLESGVRNSFRVWYGVRSSEFEFLWSLETAIVLESGMEFGVRSWSS